MKRYEDKVALITGGAGSIGKTTARLLLEEGASVMLVDLNKEALEKTVEELKSKKVAYVAADVTKAADVERYAKEAYDKYGKIDLFFNNAGIEGVVKPITEYPEEIFDKVIAVNVKGVWLGLKYVIPYMKDGSSIVITSSVAGLSGTPGMSAYVTSKHAVIGIMRTATHEVAPRKIRVNTVNPAPVDNRMMRSLEEGFSPGHGTDVKKGFENNIPLGRYAQPEEIAQMVLFLGSDDSKYITGTIEVVAGGMGA